MTNYECAERQPRLTASCSTREPAWTVWLSIGFRTGGRLHPGLAGERLPKQRPHALPLLSSPTWTWGYAATWYMRFWCSSRPSFGCPASPRCRSCAKRTLCPTMSAACPTVPPWMSVAKRSSSPSAPVRATSHTLLARPRCEARGRRSCCVTVLLLVGHAPLSSRHE